MLPSSHPARHIDQQRVANRILALHFITTIDARNIVGERFVCKPLASTVLVSTYSDRFPLSAPSGGTAVSSTIAWADRE